MTNTVTKTNYVSVTDTAKLVREALKKSFPTIKFSVRSDSYAGGASITVSYTDGPTTKAVDEVVQPFAGATFDGMQDLKEYHSVMVNGVRTHYGADFIHSSRTVSIEKQTQVLKDIFEQNPEHPLTKTMPTLETSKSGYQYYTVNHDKDMYVNKHDTYLLHIANNGDRLLYNPYCDNYNIVEAMQWFVSQIDFTPATAKPQPEPKQPNIIQFDNTPVITLNNALNGIEVKFNRKPNQDILTALSGATINGNKMFRWHNVKKLWYAKQTDKAFELLNTLFNYNS